MFEKSNFTLFVYQFETPHKGFVALNQLTHESVAHVIDFCLLPTGQGYGLLANVNYPAQLPAEISSNEVIHLTDTSISRKVLDTLIYLHPRPASGETVLCMRSSSFIAAVKWLNLAVGELGLGVIEFRTPRTLNSMHAQGLFTLTDLSLKKRILNEAQLLGIELLEAKLDTPAARAYFYN